MIPIDAVMMTGRLAWPKKIAGLQWQFLKYKLPDDKISQDIVSVFITFAGFLWWLGFDETALYDEGEGKRGDEVSPSMERNSRLAGDRYSRMLPSRA